MKNLVLALSLILLGSTAMANKISEVSGIEVHDICLEEIKKSFIDQLVLDHPAPAGESVSSVMIDSYQRGIIYSTGSMVRTYRVQGNLLFGKNKGQPDETFGDSHNVAYKILQSAKEVPDSTGNTCFDIYQYKAQKVKTEE